MAQLREIRCPVDPARFIGVISAQAQIGVALPEADQHDQKRAANDEESLQAVPAGWHIRVGGVEPVGCLKHGGESISLRKRRTQRAERVAAASRSK